MYLNHYLNKDESSLGMEPQCLCVYVLSLIHDCSFYSGTGSGFEAFFTDSLILVVAIATKRDFTTLSLNDCPLSPLVWVSSSPVHVSLLLTHLPPSLPLAQCVYSIPWSQEAMAEGRDESLHRW